MWSGFGKATVGCSMHVSKSERSWWLWKRQEWRLKSSSRSLLANISKASGQNGRVFFLVSSLKQARALKSEASDDDEPCAKSEINVHHILCDCKTAFAWNFYKWWNDQVLQNLQWTWESWQILSPNVTRATSVPFVAESSCWVPIWLHHHRENFPCPVSCGQPRSVSC